MYRNRIGMFIAVVALFALGSVLVAAQGGGRGPEIAGVRYDTPTAPPRITREQAIQAAKDHLGSELTAQSTQIQTRHVLFSDDHYYTQDSAGQKHYHFQKVPAWIVTFEGLPLPSHGKRGSAVTFNHEAHVVINAETGEYMEMFSYQ